MEKFYKTDADAEAALVAAYEGFMCNVVGRQPDVEGSPGIYTPHKLILNECGDDILAAGENSGDNEFGIKLNQFFMMQNLTCQRYFIQVFTYLCILVIWLSIISRMQILK